MCKACGRSFNVLAGTPLARLRLREKWLDHARSFADGVSQRKAAARTDIRLEISILRRHWPSPCTCGPRKRLRRNYGAEHKVTTFHLSMTMISGRMVGFKGISTCFPGLIKLARSVRPREFDRVYYFFQL